MVNQFRVLLCNLPYVATSPQDHLARTFNGVQLPVPAKNFYNLLFKPSLTREEILFTVQNLVNVVRSTPYRNYITHSDSRITYQVDAEGQYFTAARVSQPVFFDPVFPILVSGSYTPVNDVYSESFVITQGGASQEYFQIVSGYSGYIYVPISAGLTPVFDSHGLSQVMAIPNTGLSFQMSGNAGAFTGGHRTWQFYTQAPRSFDVTGLYNMLSQQSDTVAAMLALPSAYDTSMMAYTWQNDPNLVYRLGALLVCYEARVENLIH